MIDIAVKIKCLPNDSVFVLNYRSKPSGWEDAIVTHVQTTIREDGSTYNHYSVRLVRLSKAGNYVFLTVGDDGIQPH